MTTAAPIALVTGANRGIGLEVCRQLGRLGYIVIGGARDLPKGEVAAAELQREQLQVVAHQLDVTDPASVLRLRDHLAATYRRLDVLVNNAAILYDTWESALSADLTTVGAAFETNTLGAWRMCQACVALLRRSDHGRIVNVSSEAGSLASMGSETPAYNVSKTALNALTRMLAAELHADGILVNAVCPGWVATDMGGPGGRPVTEGAAGVVWAATLPPTGPTGGFFHDGRPLPW